MQCGSCGAKIADKAIACYRCGAPTAIPAAAAAPKPDGPRPWLSVMAPLAVAIAVGVLSRMIPSGGWRQVCWLVSGVAALTAGRALFRVIRPR